MKMATRWLPVAGTREGISLPHLTEGIRITYPSRRDALVVAACMVGWPCLTALIRFLTGASDFYGVPFALAAVVISAWVSGLAASLTVTALSVILLSVNLPAAREIGVETESFWHIVVFSLIAILASGFQSTASKLRQHLQDEVEFKNSFLVLMAHELRTPATLIHSGIRVLQRHPEKLTSPEAAEIIDTIGLESGRFATLVDDLLTFARIEAGQNGVEEAVSVTHLLREEVSAFIGQHPDRAVRCLLPADDRLVFGQKRYVSIVLRHLLTNADMYSPSDRPIVLTVKPSADIVEISVRDYGPGLSKEELSSVFEPYYRGRLVPIGMRGLGLGLALSKRIVEAMRGRVSAKAPEDGGLEVRVVLPAA